MTLSIITSNISADFLSPPSVPPWEERKRSYVDVLRSAEPNIIGLQEVTPRQLQFLLEHLPEFTSLTVPVEDPAPDLLVAWKAKYEKYGFPLIRSPYEIVLFYRTATFECLSTGYWWLSPTPDIPSIGFGNTAPRVVLWAQLRHTPSSTQFVIFNTHIDQRCIHPMIELCRSKFAEFAGKYPSLFFIGDLNFNERDANYDLLMMDGWNDSHNVSGPGNTDTFLYERSGLPAGRIDHIFYISKEFTPEKWNRLLAPESDPRISDHDPVCVEFQVV